MTATPITAAQIAQLFDATGYAALLTALEKGLGLSGLLARTMTSAGQAALQVELLPLLATTQFVMEENGERFTYLTVLTTDGQALASYEQVGNEPQLTAVSASYVAEALAAC